MKIHLPDDLESSVRSLVQGGWFASEDDLIVEAVRATPPIFNVFSNSVTP